MITMLTMHVGCTQPGVLLKSAVPMRCELQAEERMRELRACNNLLQSCGHMRDC